jgi:hypothetical protein
MYIHGKYLLFEDHLGVLDAIGQAGVVVLQQLTHLLHRRTL